MNEIVHKFMEKGYLLSPGLAKELEKIDYIDFLNKINKEKSKPFILNNDLKKVLEDRKELANVNWDEFDKARVLFEKQKGKKVYNLFLNILNKDFKPVNLTNTDDLNLNEEQIQENIKDENNSNVIILKDYNDLEKKRDVETFTNYFRQRYAALKNILISRPELQNAISINRLQNKSGHEKVVIIGLVSDKRLTKNGNLLFVLEDSTGTISVVFSKNKPFFSNANDVLLDEVIGVTGLNGDKIIFADNLYFPDVPSNNQLKKFDEEIYIAFTSDMQVGNKLFFEKNFLKFIDWLNMDRGDERQKELAKKVKYLFIPGDIVEGVGVYPGQEEDLLIQDIYKQYDKFAEYIGKIRKDIKIVISPGNHDAIQIAEPQPAFDKNLAPALHELPNVYITTNPSLVNICSTKDFSGFNILMYHGFSFIHVAENVDTIRKLGRLERPDLIMKFLLQKRHLAPSHTSTLYLPNAKEDSLIIDKVPDFFISGHLHKSIAANYKGVTTVNCSCWIDSTEDQERRGVIPDPCKVILVNLKTRDIKILNFKENE